MLPQQFKREFAQDCLPSNTRLLEMDYAATVRRKLIVVMTASKFRRLAYLLLSGDLGFSATPQLPPSRPDSNGFPHMGTSRPASASGNTDSAQFHAGSRVLYNRDGIPVKGTVAKLTQGQPLSPHLARWRHNTLHADKHVLCVGIFFCARPLQHKYAMLPYWSSRDLRFIQPRIHSFQMNWLCHDAGDLRLRLCSCNNGSTVASAADGDATSYVIALSDCIVTASQPDMAPDVEPGDPVQFTAAPGEVAAANVVEAATAAWYAPQTCQALTVRLEIRIAQHQHLLLLLPDCAFISTAQSCIVCRQWSCICIAYNTDHILLNGLQAAILYIVDNRGPECHSFATSSDDTGSEAFAAQWPSANTAA